MQKISYNDVNLDLAKVLEDAQSEPVAIIRNGKPAAVIVDHDDFLRYQQYQEQQLKQEFDRLMQRHHLQVEALADR